MPAHASTRMCLDEPERDNNTKIAIHVMRRRRQVNLSLVFWAKKQKKMFNGLRNIK